MILTLWALIATASAGDLPAPLSRLEATRLIGSCAIRRDRAHAIDVATAEPGTPAFQRAIDRIELALEACLNGHFPSMTIRVNDLRGVFAEAFLKESGGAALSRAQALAPVPAKRVALGKNPAANDAMLFHCAVAAEPKQAAMLVASAPESTQEAAAFGAMAPALQQCVPQEAEMRLKSFQIRLLVAAALFGLVAAGPGA